MLLTEQVLRYAAYRIHVGRTPSPRVRARVRAHPRPLHHGQDGHAQPVLGADNVACGGVEAPPLVPWGATPVATVPVCVCVSGM